MGVSRSACYDYVRCTDHCSADPCHLETLETIRDLAKSSHHSYGSRRIGKALNARGYPVGRWKARRLMQEAGVQVRYRKKHKVKLGHLNGAENFCIIRSYLGTMHKQGQNTSELLRHTFMGNPHQPVSC